jgi:hypothetical protein
MCLAQLHQQVMVECEPQAVVAPQVELAPHRRERRERL